MADAAAHAFRQRVRRGEWCAQTAGQAPGFLQGNLVILDAAHALDFARFCQRNPKPCPVIGIGDTGDPCMPLLGRDVDVRTDVPRYRVFRDGVAAGECDDVRALWDAERHVAFVLGCSFTFERALLDAGIPVRHIEAGCTVPMFRTSLQTARAGPFGGPMVVSMRPMTPADAERATAITARFPLAHGAPVHVGDPQAIGIARLDKPDFGDAVDVRAGEVPVFWACGVTPQVAVQGAQLPLVITHAPGHMLVTDIAGE